ncbi:MAG TPA: ABC transporter permease [Anaerolineae bacterium]|nr:ABC transporter permease [Anaerolineae bacterium]
MIRNTLANAWKDLLILLKDKGVLAVYFLMPLLFASLLGIAFGNAANEETTIEIEVLLVNQDGGTYGQMLADGLLQAEVLILEELANAAQAEQQIADGDAAAAIVIPADFSSKLDTGEPVEVLVIQDPTQMEAAEIVAGVANQAMAEIGMLGELRYGIHAVLAQSPDYDQAPPELVEAIEAQTLGVMWTQVQQMRQEPVIAVKGEPVAGAEEVEPWDPITYYIPGFTVAFAFFLIGQMAMTLLREKEEGTFRRLLVAPMPRASIVSGKMLAYLIVIFLQVIILFTVGYTLFKMPLGQSPVALLLLTLALGLAATSLGMVLGSLCRTSQQADRLGMVTGFVLLALGGTILPLFRSEGLMGTLSRLTPSAWAIEGYMGLVADNWTLMQTLPNILIVFGFAVVFFAIAVWRFKFE